MPVQTTTVTGQQSIPEQLMPYFTGASGIPGLLPKAQEIFSKGYAEQYGTPLEQAGLTGAGRIAPMSAMQQQVGQQLGQMGTPAQFGAGMSAAEQAQQAYRSLGQVGTGPLTQYQMAAPTAVETSPLTQFQISPAQQFTSSTAQQYMSPYQQYVTDIAKREAIRGAQIGQLGQNLAAARQGTYGGARQMLAQTERERNLQTQLGDIQARGLQEAFTNAQQQFERDRAAGLTTAQQNLQALLGVQQLGSTQSLEAQRLNQAAQQAAAQQNLQAALGVQQLGATQSLEAQKANLASQVQAAQGLGALGDVFTRAGTAQQASDIDRLKTMGAYGDLQRALAQQQIDARYQDFLKRIEYPQQQLGSMADILRGVPITKVGETSTTTTPPPSFASQLAGLGLSGLSLYNLLK